MHRALFIGLYFLSCVVATAAAASAEFLRTNLSVYQGSDLHTKIIISRLEPGIMLASGPEIALQKFDPDRLQKPDTAHCFIRFDPKSNRYSALLVGNREYRLNGSASLVIGQMRVTIDNQNPYLSIIQNTVESGGKPGILGFTGIEPVINAVGEDAVALLEANKFSRYTNLIKPYDVTPGGLKLDNEPVAAEFVGVDLEVPLHPCAGKDAVVISREKSGIPDDATAQAREKLLSALAASRPGKNPLDQWLNLRTSDESIIAFDFESTAVKVVHKIAAPRLPKFVCIVDTREVGL